MSQILKNNYYHIFLGGQSSVIKSFKKLEFETFDSVIQPLKIILEFIRTQKNIKTKLMFMVSSEMFGNQNKKEFWN